MKIGFFGDSFVMEESNPHSWYHNYDTYIRKIKKHYNADIVHLGHGGSSYWDVILNQFPKFEKDLPDVSIFCWTDPSRIFHPTVRNLGIWCTKPTPLKDITYTQLLNPKAYKAANDYFTYLHDENKSQREMLSALYYFDREVLKPLENKTKIIHCWSFGWPKPRPDTNIWFPSNIEYKYKWQTGVELRPSLRCFTPEGKDYVASPNHLGTKESNDAVAEMLITVIENHTNGKLMTRY